MLDAAVTATKSLDDKVLAEWLRKNRVDTIQGKLRFDGPSNYGDDLMRVKQVQNGRWVTVWPKSSAAPGAVARAAPDRQAAWRCPALRCSRSRSCPGSSSGRCTGCWDSGLSLSWGMLRQINLAHFALAFLGAYLCYQLSAVGGMDPLATLLVIVPGFFALGVALQWLFARFAISAFNSLLVTFGLTVIVESLIQTIWTADFRRLGVASMATRHFASARCTCRCPSCSRLRCR